MKNERLTAAQKIRDKYTEKERTELDELYELDRRVKHPVNIFAYIFGAISAVIMGMGMSLVMTDISSVIGIDDGLVPGIIIGAIGLILAIVNYPIYKSAVGARKKRYAPEIISLSDKIINK